MHPLHQRIQTLLDRAVAGGDERGVQVTIYHEGKLVANAFAGIADVRTGRAVDADTLFPVFSVTKGIFSTVIHVLAERGLIDYDEPIATYWPGFAANGKAAITMRHALSHSSGIPFLPDDITLEQLADWDFMCGVIEKLRPVSMPGAQQHYHAITSGWIWGEVARRVSGRNPSQLFAEELCRRLGLTRMFCGIPAEVEPQTAYLEIFPDVPQVLGPPPREIPPSAQPLHEWMNRTAARLAPQPAASGIMNAHSIARHYASLLPGGVDGIELLPRERMRIATEEQALKGGKALGYELGKGAKDRFDSVTAFGHGGHGGAMGFAEPTRRIAWAMTHNRFSNYPLNQHVFDAMCEELELPK
jgi:CubicO group peptidase (beta-lactamase class C family)